MKPVKSNLFHEVRICHGNEWEGKCNLSCHLHSGRRSDTGFAFEANKKNALLREGLAVWIFF